MPLFALPLIGCVDGQDVREMGGTRPPGVGGWLAVVVGGAVGAGVGGGVGRTLCAKVSAAAAVGKVRIGPGYVRVQQRADTSRCQVPSASRMSASIACTVPMARWATTGAVAAGS